MASAGAWTILTDTGPIFPGPAIGGRKIGTKGAANGVNAVVPDMASGGGGAR